MSTDLSEVIAAHEATNAKLLLRVAELEEANTGLAQAISDKCREEESLHEQVATLTQQLESAKREVFVLESDCSAGDCGACVQCCDAAKADAARLREALRPFANMMSYRDLIDQIVGCLREHEKPTAEAAFKNALAAFDGLPDSAAWLESKIAERTALHVEREKSLEQQLVAATNDAARAELRARELDEELGDLVGRFDSMYDIVTKVHLDLYDTNQQLPVGEQRIELCERSYAALAQCLTYPGRYSGAAESLLAASPDSDERLREVMETVLWRVDMVNLPMGKLARAEVFKKCIDEVLGVKS